MQKEELSKETKQRSDLVGKLFGKKFSEVAKIDPETLDLPTPETIPEGVAVEPGTPGTPGAAGISPRPGQPRQLKISAKKKVIKGFAEVAIVTPEGKCLEVKHNGKGDEVYNMANWRLVSNQFDSKGEIIKSFNFPLPAIGLANNPNENSFKVHTWFSFVFSDSIWYIKILETT